MITIGIVVLVVMLLLAAGMTIGWYCRPAGAHDRLAAARQQALFAEAGIDLLTRQAMQQMRDVVREDLRRQQRGPVIDGDVID